MNARKPSSEPVPRPALVAARKHLRMRQEDAAEAIGVSLSTWSRWEQGKQKIRRAHRTRIAALFGVTLAEVDHWADGGDGAPSQGWPAEWTQTSADTVDSVSELWRWDVHPSRRTVLATLPWMPSYLGDWLLSWSLDPAASSRARSGTRRSVGIEDVHRVREASDAFAQMDHQFGGGLVRPAVIDFLHNTVGPMLRGTYTDEVGAALLTAAAVMTGLAGWQAYDLNQQGLAQAHFGKALQLAKAADDPLTSACLLMTMSQQAIDLHEPTWAVRLARAAMLAGEQADAAPRVRAGLLLREARANALAVELADARDTHTTLRVERMLGEAYATFTKARPGDDEPVWIHDLTEPEMAAEAGCVWRMIGRPAKAAQCAELALTGFGSRFPRSIQFNRIHRGQALLSLGELEAAITSAREAIPAANALTSQRCVQMVQTFDQELDAYRRERRVREWRDYLHTALTTSAA